MSKVEFDCGKWLQEAEEFALPNWSALPSIPLYMDQVMMFTGEALSLFERDEKQSLLTNSMINNYVKSGVVDHPVHKKYSKEHLSKLMMVGLLKQVLSIQDIAVLFSGNEDAEQLYKDFAAAQSGALHETAAGVHPESDAAASLYFAPFESCMKRSAVRSVCNRTLSAVSSARKTLAVGRES